MRTSIEKLWSALLQPEFTRQYWYGMDMLCDWKAGASWQLRFADGRLAAVGEVLEIEPPRGLVVSWQNEYRPEVKAEDPSTCTFELALSIELAKLTVTHVSPHPKSQLIAAVASGWPKILPNLKSLLETGQPMSIELV